MFDKDDVSIDVSFGHRGSGGLPFNMDRCWETYEPLFLGLYVGPPILSSNPSWHQDWELIRKLSIDEFMSDEFRVDSRCATGGCLGIMFGREDLLFEHTQRVNIPTHLFEEGRVITQPTNPNLGSFWVAIVLVVRNIETGEEVACSGEIQGMGFSVLEGDEEGKVKLFDKRTDIGFIR